MVRARPTGSQPDLAWRLRIGRDGSVEVDNEHDEGAVDGCRPALGNRNLKAVGIDACGLASLERRVQTRAFDGVPTHSEEVGSLGIDLEPAGPGEIAGRVVQLGTHVLRSDIKRTDHLLSAHLLGAIREPFDDVGKGAGCVLGRPETADSDDKKYRRAQHNPTPRWCS